MHRLISAATLLLLFSCTEFAPTAPGPELIVVQAFLENNHAVADIQLTAPQSINSSLHEGEPITDAEVQLKRNESAFSLESNPAKTGFYDYSGNDLRLEEQDTLELLIRWNNRDITARTFVPSTPVGVKFSIDTISIPPVSPPNDLRLSTLLSWEATQEQKRFFYVTIENVDENPRLLQPANPRTPEPLKFTSLPFQEPYFEISKSVLTHTGRHAVIVYHINQEYANLNTSQQQDDSHSLNEIPSNIRNGLGIFTAFSKSDTAYFHVVQ